MKPKSAKARTSGKRIASRIAQRKHSRNSQPSSLWARLGPGLITGAADDDPSGIATYSQVGAGFGYNILWTTLFTFPLMVGIQTVSARIGRVTGHGLAANIRRYYPHWLVYTLVLLLLTANVINIAADIGAMGAALQLLVGGSAQWYGAAFGLLSVVLQVFIPFPRYAPILKLLTLALLSYVASLFVLNVPWGDVVVGTLLPRLSLQPDYIVAVVAVFGTTISPYLFFWQASQEVEEQRAANGEQPLVKAPEQARSALQRIKLDTYIGMAFSNLVAFCIMLTAVTTLHLHGTTDVQSAAEAAEALRPLAGDLAFTLFSLGIIGTGLLAVPVLAGSAAYGMAEAFRWRMGLGLNLEKAKSFYAIIVVATLLGIGLNFTPIDPIKALFWSAVINGVVAVPVMTVMMLMARRKEIMGTFVIKTSTNIIGWIATAVMAAMVAAMFVTWGQS